MSTKNRQGANPDDLPLTPDQRAMLAQLVAMPADAFAAHRRQRVMELMARMGALTRRDEPPAEEAADWYWCLDEETRCSTWIPRAENDEYQLLCFVAPAVRADGSR